MVACGIGSILTLNHADFTKFSEVEVISPGL